MTGETLNRCPSCQNSVGITYLWGLPHIVRCPKCGLAYVKTMPTLEELAHMYSAEFFKGSSSYADYVAEKKSLQNNFQRRLPVLRKYAPSGRLYEAGCAHGFFLELARQHWEVSGSDISEDAVRYARDELGLNVQVGDFESLPPAPNSYEVVVMWDTIEHLYDPVLAVQKSAEALRPGGILALTTGDIDTPVPRFQKKNWRLVHPCHLYYFSRQSMTYLLEKHGLEVVHFSHPGNYRTLTQMAMVLTYGKTRENWRHSLFHQIEKLSFLNHLTINVNLFDIMFVVARKK